MKTFEELFDEVAQQIDWEKIRKIMGFLEWTWFSVETITVYDLIKQGEKLCKEVYIIGNLNKREHIIGTGGFTAIYNPEDNSLTLQFILEEGCSYDVD